MADDQFNIAIVNINRMDLKDIDDELIEYLAKHPDFLYKLEPRKFEILIASILKNLPKKIGKANITLGLPIRNTALRTWVDLIFSIQENKKRFKTKWIYFNDLQNFWNHPFLLSVLSKEEKDQLILAEAEIIKYNRIFVNPEKLEISATAFQLLQNVTSNWNSDWKIAMAFIRNSNELIYKKLESEFAF